MNVRAITTSWDDGHPQDMRLADLLSRHQLRGTFYIPRQWSLPVMTDAQVRELATRHEVGGHTINHVMLTSVCDTQAQREIVDGRNWLADVTGQTITMFCPPCGKFKAHHRRMIAEAGYIGLRTVECWSIDGWRMIDGIMEMPTTCQAFSHSMCSHLTNLLKRRNGTGLGLWLRTYRWDWVAQLQRAARQTIQSGGVFHLWGHSWEIDQFNLWEGLDRLFATLAELSHSANAMTNGQVCREAALRRLRRRHQAAQGMGATAGKQVDAARDV